MNAARFAIVVAIIVTVPLHADWALFEVDIRGTNLKLESFSYAQNTSSLGWIRGYHEVQRQHDEWFERHYYDKSGGTYSGYITFDPLTGCYRSRLDANFVPYIGSVQSRTELNENGTYTCFDDLQMSPNPPPTLPTTCHNCGGTMPEPLILDLAGDGIATSSLADDPVLFDMNGDGIRDGTAWTVEGADDAFLYFDLKRNGQIDGAQELFGDATLMPDGQRAPNGFEALAVYDLPEHGGDGNGRISPSDRVWGLLRLWVDRSHDGVASHDEEYTLASTGVIAIHVGYRVLTAAENYGRDAAGNWHWLQGTFEQRRRSDVVVRAVHDVFFQAHLR